MSFVIRGNIASWHLSVLEVFTHNTVFSLSHAYALCPVLLIGFCVLHCRAKKAVQLPDYHYIDHRIEILSHDKDYNKVKLDENAVARCCTLSSQAK